MGLNQTFRSKAEQGTGNEVVHYSLVPVPVRALRSYKLVSIAAGKSHSAAIDQYNRMLTLGNNEYGQLGTGDFKPREGPVLVRGDLGGKEVRDIVNNDSNENKRSKELKIDFSNISYAFFLSPTCLWNKH